MANDEDTFDLSDIQHAPARAGKTAPEAREALPKFDPDDYWDFDRGRSSEDAHRAWVDHQRIPSALLDDEKIESLWNITGLDKLDATDRKLPRDLRRLLATRTSGRDDILFGLALLPLSGVPVMAVGWTLHNYSWELSAKIGTIGAWVVGGGVVGILGLRWLIDVIAGWLGHTVWGSPEYRMGRALVHLKAHPFAIVAEGYLVENIPSLCWLEAQIVKLRSSISTARDHVSEIDRLQEKLRKADADVHQKGPDAQLARLVETRKAQQDLVDRGERLEARLQEKWGQMRRGLDELKKRLDLEALREQAATVAGQAAPFTPEHIEADLEVDVADLAKDVDALHDQIAEENARLVAANEVSSL